MARRKKSPVAAVRSDVASEYSPVLTGANSERSLTSVVPEPHCLERAVLHGLLAIGEVTFEDLTVRRTPNGLCLQGVVDCGEKPVDLCSIARQVSGVEHISNLLVMRSCRLGAFD